MDEKMKSLQVETKATDVTKEGVVTVAVNGIGIEDTQHDISMPGSFINTLEKGIYKMRWFLNHDTRQLLGVPLSGEEKDNNLIMTGRINLNKQIGRDTLADYELFAEAGRTLEHSIGVRAVKRDETDRRKVLEWDMLEYSTLTAWGANPNTYLVGIKSGSEQQLREAADFIRLALKQRGYSDERLKNYDMELNLLLKSLTGGLVVSCPCCGYQFDYDSEQEYTFTDEVRDAVMSWLHWTGQDIVRQEMERFRPEVRIQVLDIIDSMKGTRETITEKSITDSLAYVRCPECWSRVYRRNSILIPEEKSLKPAKITEKPAEDLESSTPDASFWEKLNESFINIKQSTDETHRKRST